MFVRRGIIPRRRRVLPAAAHRRPQRAKEIKFFGDDVSAADAERYGNREPRVVPAATSRPSPPSWRAGSPTAPTKTVAMTKWLLNRSFESSRHTSFEEESFAQEMINATADSAEGMKAFMERRSPDFKGW